MVMRDKVYRCLFSNSVNCAIMIKKRLSLLQNAFCNDDMFVLCHHGMIHSALWQFEVNDSSRRFTRLIIPQLMVLKYMYNCTVPIINIATKSSVPDHLTFTSGRNNISGNANWEIKTN